MPSLFLMAHPDPARVATVRMSEFVSILLIGAYVLSLVYSMWTHKAMFAESTEGHAEPPQWSMTKTMTLLVASAAAIGVMSEMLVGATEAATQTMGLSEFFVGIILVPIIGNAAEHSSAVMMAYKNRMDLAVNIALGSTVQVALLVAPLLVFLGVIVGQPMDLAFTTLEVVAVTLARVDRVVDRPRRRIELARGRLPADPLRDFRRRVLFFLSVVIAELPPRRSASVDKKVPRSRLRPQRRRRIDTSRSPGGDQCRHDADDGHGDCRRGERERIQRRDLEQQGRWSRA